jgi:hypothetical protein|tara:strand:+ start:62 stop:403 length:342 start_codon:yes stop_codon:yes gene_type:complete
MKIKKLLLFFLALNLSTSASIPAEKCEPNDPGGINKNTLCIKHYSNVIKKSSIDYGRGTEAHYGPYIDPLQPNKGTFFRKKSFTTNEFYTNVEVGDKSNGVRVKTSRGRVFVD